IGLVGEFQRLLRLDDHAVHRRDPRTGARDLRLPAVGLEAVQEAQRDEGVELVESVEGEDGDAHRRTLHQACQSSNSERSIHAACSCTARRCVTRSAVGSSLALSTSGKMARAVRATASWPSTRMRTISSALGGVTGTSFSEVSWPN